ESKRCVRSGRAQYSIDDGAVARITGAGGGVESGRAGVAQREEPVRTVVSRRRSYATHGWQKSYPAKTQRRKENKKGPLCVFAPWRDDLIFTASGRRGSEQASNSTLGTSRRSCRFFVSRRA